MNGHAYPKYERYKDTGAEWLGKMPDHWDATPLFRILKERFVRNTGNRVQDVLSLSYGKIVPRDVDSNFGLLPDSFETYQIVEPGNIVLRLTDLQNDRRSLRVGHAMQRGIVTSAYVNLETAADIDNRYVYYLLNAYDRLKVFYGMGAGVRQTMKYADLKRMPCVLPPHAEQVAIAAFLDRETARIDALIERQERLIEKLEEKRKALISRAVTQGLSPNVKMKDSRVEWLGRIPEHWDIAALRRYWQVTDCKHMTVPFVDDGYPIASVVEVQSFDLDLSRCKRTTEEWHKRLIGGGRKPRRGDLIYCRNASVGACAFVNTDEPLSMGQDVCLIQSHTENQRYLNYLLHSCVAEYQLGMLLVGSTLKRLNISDIRALTVLRPSKGEQDAIAAFLNEQMDRIQGAMFRCEILINTLRERRTALISSAVTGKIDVREVANG